MNVFFVYDDGTRRHPRLTGSILEGVTRSSILELATDAGHEVAERADPARRVARRPRRRASRARCSRAARPPS